MLYLRCNVACNASLNCPCVRGLNVCIFCVDAHFLLFSSSCANCIFLSIPGLDCADLVGVGKGCSTSPARAPLCISN